ncbi:MAG: YebC/PmpR family DNA-binding transcriptional regulator [Clostridia bacterium]|nr:YebC/PmpR family DNA-binding transcriptional regulator [Clostridia bacterium]
MSGHSKFHNIKATKDKADATRGRVFTKIGREIAVAVKMGGPDPTINSKLYDAIAKAKQNNMPNDTIQRSIKKASGATNTDNFDAITYEGYGPNGVAFIVECLTDNRNRTASDVRHLFDKHGGSLGTTGSVMYMFDKKGVIMLEQKDGVSEDDVMMLALDNGADDVVSEDDGYVVYTLPENFHTAVKAFEEAGFPIVSSGVEYVSSNNIELDEAKAESIEKLKDALEDLDDVQVVYTNAL